MALDTFGNLVGMIGCHRLAGLIVLLSLSSSSGKTPRTQVEESGTSHLPPPQWKYAGKAKSILQLELVIALRQQNLDELEDKLIQVSTPGNHQYGQHLSHREVTNLVQPSPETFSKVLSWLEEAGVSAPTLEKAKSSTQDFMEITVPLRVAENLVGVQVFT